MRPLARLRRAAGRTSTSTACRRPPGIGFPYLERIGGVAPDLPASAAPLSDGISITRSRAWSRGSRPSSMSPAWSASRCRPRLRRLRPRLRAALLRADRAARIHMRPVAARLPLALGRAHLADPYARRAVHGHVIGWAFKQISRQATDPALSGRSSTAQADFDRGTRRAILRLYHMSPPDVLARRQRAWEIRCPTLVLGPATTLVGRSGSARYAEALGGTCGWRWWVRPLDLARPARTS